jgi:uncharacterized protein
MLPMIPAELTWQHPPLEWNVEADSFTISAGESTDWFIDPMGSYAKDNAPAALFKPPDQNFLLSAKVSVQFGSAFDAGTVQVRAGNDLWAKLAFEYSPQKQPMIVSVVTRGVSDDCNSVLIDGTSIYLRIAHNAPAFAFHYSLDGKYWHLVRYFSLGNLDSFQVGFSAQSPTGQHCTALFTEVNNIPTKSR